MKDDNSDIVGAGIDAWLDAMPENAYDLCPCGCGMKFRFAMKPENHPEEHEKRFLDNFYKNNPVVEKKVSYFENAYNQITQRKT